MEVLQGRVHWDFRGNTGYLPNPCICGTAKFSSSSLLTFNFSASAVLVLLALPSSSPPHLCSAEEHRVARASYAPGKQYEVGAKVVGIPGSSELKQGLFKTISHIGCNNSHVVLTTFFNENLLCVFYAPGFKCLSSVRQSPCCIKWEVALQWLWAVYILGYHIYLWGKS